MIPALAGLAFLACEAALLVGAARRRAPRLADPGPAEDDTPTADMTPVVVPDSAERSPAARSPADQARDYWQRKAHERVGGDYVPAPPWQHNIGGAA